MVEDFVARHILRPIPECELTDEQLVNSLSRAIWLTYFAGNLDDISYGG